MSDIWLPMAIFITGAAPSVISLFSSIHKNSVNSIKDGKSGLTNWGKLTIVFLIFSASLTFYSIRENSLQHQEKENSFIDKIYLRAKLMQVNFDYQYHNASYPENDTKSMMINDIDDMLISLQEQECNEIKTQNPYIDQAWHKFKDTLDYYDKGLKDAYPILLYDAIEGVAHGLHEFYDTLRDYAASSGNSDGLKYNYPPKSEDFLEKEWWPSLKEAREKRMSK